VAETRAYIDLTIDLSEPIELSDFAGLFASFASQFDDYLEEMHPDLHGEAKIFVKEVRQGSIIAALVPIMQALIETMDTALIVKQFSEWVSRRVTTYTDGRRLADANKTDITQIADMVKAVANNQGGEARLESVHYVDGEAKKALILQFDTKEARRAMETLEAHKIDLDKRETADHRNVLMVFIQANVKAPELGKRSGEQVLIEAIDPKPRPISYESELARQKIKGEIDAAGENVFKKGFFVDVNVEFLRGHIAAYKITAVIDVIDLPDDTTPLDEGS
jgi:hypothetical protein